MVNMKPLRVSDASTVILGLQEEIQRSEESRYDHRLHGVLLVAQGMSCRQVAGLLGDGPRTVQYWVHAFEREGLAGLQEGQRPGRPRRLSDRQIEQLQRVLRQPPEQVGLEVNFWDGKALSEYLHQRWDVGLGVRQCQRLFRTLGFRLRKPRSAIAHADPQLHRQHKKTPKTGGRPQR